MSACARLEDVVDVEGRARLGSAVPLRTERSPLFAPEKVQWFDTCDAVAMLLGGVDVAECWSWSIVRDDRDRLKADKTLKAVGG